MKNKLFVALFLVLLLGCKSIAAISKHWKCDYFHYKERHLVKCFFMKTQDYRRIAMRFEKRARRFLGMVYLASCLIWLA